MIRARGPRQSKVRNPTECMQCPRKKVSTVDNGDYSRVPGPNLSARFERETGQGSPCGPTKLCEIVLPDEYAARFCGRKFSVPLVTRSRPPVNDDGTVEPDSPDVF